MNRDRQAFEDWARRCRWFEKVRGNFRRNSNDTAYTHYKVNDRANAFFSGLEYARQQAAAQPASDTRAVVASLETACRTLQSKLPLGCAHLVGEVEARYALQSVIPMLNLTPEDPTGFSAEGVLDEAKNWTSRCTGRQMLLNYAAFLSASLETKKGEGN